MAFKIGSLIRPLAIGLAASTGNVPLAMGIAAATSAGVSAVEKDKLGEGLFKAVLSGAGAGAGAGVAKSAIDAASSAIDTAPAALEATAAAIPTPDATGLAGVTGPASDITKTTTDLTTTPTPPTPMTTSQKANLGLGASQLALQAQQAFQPQPQARPGAQFAGVPFNPASFQVAQAPQVGTLPPVPPLFGNFIG